MKSNGSNLEISVNGITVCYDAFGEGNAPVLFVHGFPFDKSMWSPQMNALQSMHRVIAYDIRGFGKSSAGDEQPGISLFADDLVGLMDKLNIREAVVCGLSMGGYILLNAVSRFPERFKALVLCDTQCIADSPEGQGKRFKTIRLIEEGGINEFVEAFLKNIFAKDSITGNKELVQKIKEGILSTSPETITGTLAALAGRSETCQALDSISVPVMILCGKEDVVTPPAQSELMNKKIKNSELHILDRAGHMSNLEQVDDFNGHLENFLSGFRSKEVAF